MTSTNHALSGGLIGAFLPLPVAIPVAFISHFVLDALPHYGEAEHLKGATSAYKNFVLWDTLFALIIALAGAIFHKWDMWIAGWVSYGPDATLVYYYFKQGDKSVDIKSQNWFMKLHRRIQFERPWGIYVEAVMAAAMLPILIYEFLK